MKLRKKGLTYSEILEKVPVAKSTLSLWLRDVGLAKKQKQRITKKSKDAAKRGAAKKKRERILKTKRIKKKAKSEIKDLIKDELWITGLMLYWAEGSKSKKWRHDVRLEIINMDPEILKIFKRWCKKYLKIKDKEITYALYIHKRSDNKESEKFWEKELNIPKNKLKVYYKKNNPNPVRKNINKNYNGSLVIRIRKSTDLRRKVEGWIEGVIEYLKQ